MVALLSVWLHLQRLRRIALVQFADSCRPVVGEVVLIGDEEYPVILGLVAQLGPQRVSPEGRAVGPVPGPLLVAPGVSELKDLELLTLIFHLINGKDGIGMIRDEADLLELRILLGLLPGRASQYNESAFI